jgi:hypothetical protein
LAKFYTPQVRFANSGSALTLGAVQTVENTVQFTSDHADQPEHFSGVIRYRRDYRRFLVEGVYQDVHTYFQLGDISGNLGPGGHTAGLGSVSGSGGGVFFSFTTSDNPH